MEKESLKNNILISYSALAEYQKHWDKAQNKLNEIHKKMRDKNNKENLITAIKAPFVIYLLLMFFGTIYNIFWGEIDKATDISAFHLLFMSLKGTFEAFTFQAGLGSAAIGYGIYFMIVWWFREKVFNEDEITINYLMQLYQHDTEFENDFNDYKTLKQRSYNFTQTERFKTDVEFIPNNYRNAGIVAKLFGYIDDGRADTLKEAINLYEIESHQERIEAEHRWQSESIRRAEEAAINAQNAARNAEINSRYRDTVDVNIRYK